MPGIVAFAISNPCDVTVTPTTSDKPERIDVRAIPIWMMDAFEEDRCIEEGDTLAWAEAMEFADTRRYHS